jgi:hypothetical protein
MSVLGDPARTHHEAKHKFKPTPEEWVTWGQSNIAKSQGYA